MTRIGRSSISHRFRRLSSIAMALSLVLLFAPVTAGAAPDDVEALPVENPVHQRFEIDDNNIEANVFQPHGSAKVARTSLDTRLKMQIDEIHRICELNDSQKQRLKLAGSNDVRRFFEEFEVVKKKYKEGKKDQDAWQAFWQDIQPLRTKISSGLFGDKSFFAKSTRSVLNEEQTVKYDASLRERRLFRYQSCIEVVMETVEDTVPLRDHQHEAVVKLLLQETPVPLSFGQFDQHVVMYNLSKIPGNKLKTELDDRQWKLLQPKLNQYRGYEHMLKEHGVLPKDDGDVKKIKARVRKLIKQTDVTQGAADADQPENKKTE